MWELPTKKPESAAVLLRNYQNNLFNIQLAFEYTGLENGDRSHPIHVFTFIFVISTDTLAKLEIAKRTRYPGKQS